MLKHILAATAALGILTAASSAGAVVIWEDQFNRANSNTVGNGWQEDENDANDVSISGNAMRMRDSQSGSDASATQFTIDLTGYENIEIVFRWQPLSASENSDDIFVNVRIDATSGSFSQVFQDGLGGSGWNTDSINIGSAANDIDDFDLQFEIDVDDDSDGNNEGVLIDYVQITGDRIVSPTASVSEPATLGLLGLGLLGLGLTSRRRKQR
jgi:hypothetical protein